MIKNNFVNRLKFFGEKLRTIIPTLVFLAIAFLFVSEYSLAQEYVPIEPIPGTPEGDQTTFPGYVGAVYRFAVWTVGIAALLMISIGGFMYFTAAGNNSRMETAKKVIGDALFGLVAVMVAWLVLNVINPDLVNINLNSINNLRP
ncbi:MAG: hypothetical protein PHH24_02220 [Candidatus Moranbacteria bacterium]|jgi:hypothetical protein|nr:hypothetical protein [Candidatus Moranbacteria bacterium]MDD5651841.1 hypothetical protein [Candidatus Moranbacteria bacterium]MDX9855439.1 hypothetical protein [Candidatus Moranbacteria bacterium]